MIFSELYSAYFNAVALILKQACDHPLSKAELRRIVNEKAFDESLLKIEPALLEERWQLLRPDGTTTLGHIPTMPLTTLQKRWLKAILLDPRIRLFPDLNAEELWAQLDAEPLFRPESICRFDQYLDGDPYEDENYIRHFRTILDAIHHRTPLRIEARNKNGEIRTFDIMPETLEYSEKDDKFRLYGRGRRYQYINLARIVRCEAGGGEIAYEPEKENQLPQRTVELEVLNERNALERVLMHFAHFEKQAERLDQNRYRVQINYNAEDETEMLIRILAYGPLVKVTSPDSFADLIRDRLKRQMACEKG